MSRTVIIGVGNEFRGDDGIGREVVRRLEGRVPDDVDLRESSGEALSLIELWGGASKVILVDAADADGEPGKVERMDASQEALPSAFFHASTHAFSVADGIEMARSLGQLPQTVIVFAIQGQHFDHGKGLSVPADRGVADALNHILAEVSRDAAET